MPEVIGGGGVKLHVAEAGNRGGIPLLFLHGYCQSHAAWERQLDGELARDFRLVALDLRGHGASEKPTGVADYGDSQLWADDVRAVLDALDLHRVVLVGWSYGGLVMGDYLRAYGTGRLGALAFVDAAVTDDARAQGLLGPKFTALFPDIFSAEETTSGPLLERLTALCFAEGYPLDPHLRSARLSAARSVPAAAREGMMRRRLGFDDVLRELEIPTMCFHGKRDDVVLPVASDRIVDLVPNAQLSLYPEAGHSPFYEAAERFNRELRELALRVA